jgi:tubulin beta
MHGGEIIYLQVGQAGNQIGHKFWETVLAEHGIDPSGSYTGCSDSQLTKIETHFTENSQSYSPRALVVDLDPFTINQIRASNFGRCLRPDNFLAGEYSAGYPLKITLLRSLCSLYALLLTSLLLSQIANCFAEGHYLRGEALCSIVLDVVRREAEMCDRLQGFQVCGENLFINSLKYII